MYIRNVFFRLIISRGGVELNCPLHITAPNMLVTLGKNPTCGNVAGIVTGGIGDVGSFGFVLQLFQDAAEIPADLPSQLLSHQQTLVEGLEVW